MSPFTTTRTNSTKVDFFSDIDGRRYCTCRNRPYSPRLHRTHPSVGSLRRFDGLAGEFALEVRRDSHVLDRLGLEGARPGAFLLEEPVGVPADRAGPIAQAADLELFHVAVDLREAFRPDAVPLVVARDVAVDHPFDGVAGAGGVADVPTLLEERVAEFVRIRLEVLLVGAVPRRKEDAIPQEPVGPDFEGKRLLPQPGNREVHNHLRLDRRLELVYKRPDRPVEVCGVRVVLHVDGVD